MDILDLLMARAEQLDAYFEHTFSREYVQTYGIKVADSYRSSLTTRINTLCSVIRDMGAQMYDNEGHEMG